MSTPTVASAGEYGYRDLVKLTARGIPTFAPLNNFLQSPWKEPERWKKIECKITIIAFDKVKRKEIGKTELVFNENHEALHHKLRETLEKLKEDKKTQLEFAYFEVNSKSLPYARFQFVAPREFEKKLDEKAESQQDHVYDAITILSPPKHQAMKDRVENWMTFPRRRSTFHLQEASIALHHAVPTESRLELEDRMYEGEAASVRRIAGGMNPILRSRPRHPDPIDDDELEHGKNFAINPVGFVKSSITIWFDHIDENWQNGIILFDLPFVPSDPYIVKENSVYRSFMSRLPPPYFGPDDIGLRDSYFEAFVKCLQSNTDITTIGFDRPFLLLQDLYRIIASEWIVFNTYIERELNNVEQLFEENGENCENVDLHKRLRQLMRARRRVSKFHLLVGEQLQFCKDKYATGSDCPKQFSSPVADFEQVDELLKINKARITQFIKVISSLMTVHRNDLLLHQTEQIEERTKAINEQSRLSKAGNDNLSFLTVVGGFILPFTAVAAAMAIPSDTDLGPGGKHFWVFWISGGLSGLLVLALFGLARWFGNRKYKQEEIMRMAKEISQKLKMVKGVRLEDEGDPRVVKQVLQRLEMMRLEEEENTRIAKEVSQKLKTMEDAQLGQQTEVRGAWGTEKPTKITVANFSPAQRSLEV